VRIFYYDGLLFVKANEFFDKLNKIYWKKPNKLHGFKRMFKGIVFACMFFMLFRFNFFKNKHTVYFFRTVVNFILYQNNFDKVIKLLKKDLAHVRKRIMRNNIRRKYIYKNKITKKYNYYSNYNYVMKNKFLLLFMFVIKKHLDLLGSYGSIIKQNLSFYATFFRLVFFLFIFC